MSSRFSRLSSMTRMRAIASAIRQNQGESAALSERALERDSAVEQFSELLRQVQAETRAFIAARGGRIELGERVKEFRLILRLDTAARVAHANLADPAALALVPRQRDYDFSGVGIFDGVVGQIDDDLAERAPIRPHGDVRRRQVQTQRQALLFR